jgi:hypothetical protein
MTNATGRSELNEEYRKWSAYWQLKDAGHEMLAETRISLPLPIVIALLDREDIDRQKLINYLKTSAK